MDWTCPLTASHSILEARGVRFRWPGREGFSLTLPELAVGQGERVLLLGESGSGKSTLLSLVCGTLTPDKGQIILAGTDLVQLPGAARDQLRAENVGVVFQQFNLLPFGTVMDNILLPLRFAPERRKRAQDAKATARTLCVELGLPETIGEMRAHSLSVGQQQRVAVARAMIGAPPLIIADEPTSALDISSQAAFLDLLFRQVSTHDTALLMVSHDPSFGTHFDRVLRIEDIAMTGRVTA